MKALVESKNRCCGCGACTQICPVGCITMQEDREGFLYPVKDETKCIDCGLCERVCQYHIQTDSGTALKTYACINDNQDIRKQSSSGGILSVFAQEVIQKGGTVFGVTMSSDCHSAYFMECKTEKELACIRGSKYIQSPINEEYKRVKDRLTSGKLVLFTGTPCQINGLRLFLNRDYDNLLCIDVICHGVPSPQIWKSYATYLEKKHKSTISNVCFRSKRKSWPEFGVNVELEKSKIVFNLKEYDPYMQFFLKNLSLRPSCYNCKAKKVKMADISLGDFWKVKNVCPEMDDNGGTSLVIVRTKKGEQWFDIIRKSVRYQITNYDDAVITNTAEFESVKEPKERSIFFEDAEKMSFPKLARTYAFPTTKSRAKYILYKLGVLDFTGGGYGVNDYGMEITLKRG